MSLLLAGVVFSEEEKKTKAAETSVEASKAKSKKAAKSEIPLEKGANPPQAEGEIDEELAEAAEEAKAKEQTENLTEVRQVYGWKEWVKIGKKADAMRAKLDSGARTSSLHAEGIEEFERDGRSWVRFTLRDPNREDFKNVLIKAPIKRIARVKSTDGSIERRFVVELGFAVGDRQMREEFTLNNRSTLICPVLIGRNALRHLGYLDCSRVDLAEKKVMR